MINDSQDRLIIDGYVYKAEQSMFGCWKCGFLYDGIYENKCLLKPKQTTYCQSKQRNDKRFIVWDPIGKVQ